MSENPKNDYELKKQERERARAQKSAQMKRQAMKKTILKYSVWIIVIALIGYGVVLLVESTGPQGEDFSVGYDIQGRDHVDVGAEHPPYNSNPPSSGWHYESSAEGAFYDDPLPDEAVVHNLEHGDIWIAYHPDINDEAKETLESFAGNYVVVSSRPENEGGISLVAWGRVDTFDIEGEVDTQRIEDFIARYDNRGPEKVRGIQTGRTPF